MEFIVNFKVCNNDDDETIYTGPLAESIGEFGLDAIDSIREDLGVPDFPISKFSISNPQCLTSFVIELTEEQARASGHFQGRNFLTVEAPASSMNAFMTFTAKGIHKHIVTFWRPNVKVLERIIVGERLDSDKIYHAWSMAGFPTKWDPRK